MVGARDDCEGAARRRRDRHLRLWLRHERQSVAKALSEYKHHSSRGQRKDRAGEEGDEDKHDAPRRQKPFPPQPGESVPRDPVSRGGHRHESSSAPWSSSPTSCPRYRFWTSLCHKC